MPEFFNLEETENVLRQAGLRVDQMGPVGHAAIAISKLKPGESLVFDNKEWPKDRDLGSYLTPYKRKGRLLDGYNLSSRKLPDGRRLVIRLGDRKVGVNA